MNAQAILKAPAPSGGTGTGLPEDFLAESVRRLGWAALTYAICYVVMDRIYRLSTQGGKADLAFNNVLLACGVSLGLGMFLLTRSGWTSIFVLRAGLLFEVASSLLISVGEHQHSYRPGMMLVGLSSLCAWIPVFSLLVPAGRVQSAVAAFASAAMAPAGLAISVFLRGTQPPPDRDLPVLLVPPFLMAGAAVLLAQTIYRLGARVTQAREMGSYRLVEKIGQGGMGEVWRAEHRLLAREAAIKLIAPVAGAESLPVIRQRFEREARAIAALASPHTVTLFDYGVTEEGRLYYVMELLRGIDLEELVKKYGPLPPERAAFLLLQMCASLEEAHAAGLTHRDIKPRNVLVSRLGTEYDFVKLLDFGLVKSTGAGEAQLTKPESTAGTPAFMAPETAMGGAVDSRADIYSLGCTGYWLLTGRLVFEGKTPTAILMEHVRAAPVPPSQRVETAIPAGLEALILECLAKEPGARPQGAGELRGRLEEWARDWPRARSASWWKQHRPV